MTEATLIIMKKLFLFFALSVFVLSFNAKAQDVTADFSAIDSLVEKLGKSLEKAPGNCGVADIDSFVDASKKSGVDAVASATKLHELYTQQLSDNKPSLADWTDLATSLTAQTKELTEVGDKAKAASEAVKSAPKMKAVGMAKSIKWAGDVLSITTEALSAQSILVAGIIKNLK